MSRNDIRELYQKEGWSLHCSTCGKDVFKDPRDYYMLKDELWEEICNNDYISKTDVLCLSCAEKILGRKITSEDLKTDVGCNYIYPPGENEPVQLLTKKAEEILKKIYFEKEVRMMAGIQSIQGEK